jgi:hypothetical protein
MKREIFRRLEENNVFWNASSTERLLILQATYLTFLLFWSWSLLILFWLALFFVTFVGIPQHAVFLQKRSFWEYAPYTAFGRQLRECSPNAKWDEIWIRCSLDNTWTFCYRFIVMWVFSKTTAEKWWSNVAFLRISRTIYLFFWGVEGPLVHTSGLSCFFFFHLASSVRWTQNFRCFVTDIYWNGSYCLHRRLPWGSQRTLWLPLTRFPLFRQKFPEYVVCMLKILCYSYKRLVSVFV